MKLLKLLFFDVETTGLDRVQNEIHQLSYIVEVDGETKVKRNLYLRPAKPETIDPVALQIAGVTTEQVMSYPPPRDAFDTLESDFTNTVDKYNPKDKMYPCAYNAHFDYGFLTAFYKKYNNYFGSFVNHRLLDPLPVLRFLNYCGVIYLVNYKLETVCKAFDIPIIAHDALSDITATRNLLHALRDIIIVSVPKLHVSEI